MCGRGKGVFSFTDERSGRLSSYLHHVLGQTEQAEVNAHTFLINLGVFRLKLGQLPRQRGEFRKGLGGIGIQVTTFPIQQVGADGEGFFPEGRQIFAYGGKKFNIGVALGNKKLLQHRGHMAIKGNGVRHVCGIPDNSRCIALIKKITLDFAHGACKGLRFAQHRVADLYKPACGFINIDPIFPPGADIIRVRDKFLAEPVKKVLGFGRGIGLVQGFEVRKVSFQLAKVFHARGIGGFV